jgi:hypothetical protein
MLAMDRSRRNLWLAVIGLMAVPILGFVLVLALTDDVSRRSRSGAADSRTRDEHPDEAVARRSSGSALRDPVERTAVAADPRAREGPGEPAGHGTGTGARDGDIEAGTAAAEEDVRIVESRRVETTNPRRARELLREVLRDDPDNVVALERLSAKLLIDEAHAEAKQLADRCRRFGANSSCEQTSNLAVDNPADLEVLGTALTTCLDETPDHVGCLSGMVAYHLIHGSVIDAATFAGRLTQVAPQAPETLAARGRIKAADGEYDKARQLFEWACQQNDPQACYRLEILKGEGR